LFYILSANTQRKIYDDDSRKQCRIVIDNKGTHVLVNLLLQKNHTQAILFIAIVIKQTSSSYCTRVKIVHSFFAVVGFYCACGYIRGSFAFCMSKPVRYEAPYRHPSTGSAVAVFPSGHPSRYCRGGHCLTSLAETNVVTRTTRRLPNMRDI
jgi:hypothetical protein